MATHTVVYRDTLSALAVRYGTSVAALVALNGISDPDRIYVGQVLKLPAASSPTTMPDVAPGPSTGRPLEIKVTGGAPSSCPSWVSAIYAPWMEPFCAKWPLVLGGAVFFFVGLALMKKRKKTSKSAPSKRRRRS